MSYARWGDESDVYVYLDVSGVLCCCGCGLLDTSARETTTADMVAHLRDHEAAGDKVPPDLVARLEADAEANDAWMALTPEGREAHNRAWTPMDPVGRHG